MNGCEIGDVRLVGYQQGRIVSKPQVDWTRDLPTESGLYWYWNEDPDQPPFHVIILKGHAGDECFASRGQWGWTRTQNVSEMGGWWAPLEEPDLPRVEEVERE